MSGPERTVEIRDGDATLTGSLVVSEGARGVVAFAHGSGSGQLARDWFLAHLQAPVAG